MNRIGWKGFTLVELLVVVALIGVILLIGVPSVIKQIYHQRLVRSTRELFTEISAARTNAITRNVNYEIDVNNTAYQLKYFNTGTGLWTDEPSHPEVTLNPRITFTAPATVFQVVYKPNGTVITPGNICLTNGADTTDKFSIVFTGSLGRISIVTGC